MEDSKKEYLLATKEEFSKGLVMLIAFILLFLGGFIFKDQSIIGISFFILLASIIFFVFGLLNYKNFKNH